MIAPVNVLAVMVDLISFGGQIGKREIVREWNQPQATGLVANRARYMNGMHTRLPTTAAVQRALKKAERAGVVVFCGTGETHCRSWNKSGAQRREGYWRLSDAALARVGGGQ